MADASPRTVMIDGSLVAPEAAKVSVFDRGFLYGDSVFETLRTYAGAAFALDAHLQRLAQSAALVDIPLPIELSGLKREVQTALMAAGSGEHWVRVMLTRGEGPLGLDPGVALLARRVVLVAPLSLPQASVYTDGVAVSVFHSQRDIETVRAGGAKYGNYLMSVLATRAAHREGAHEALIADSSGRIAEGASSNLFFVVNGELCTPPLSAGILAGITRGQLILAAERLGIPLAYSVPTLAELTAATEVAISSSIRELVPVVRVANSVIGTGKPGAVILRLLAEFRRSLVQ